MSADGTYVTVSHRRFIIAWENEAGEQEYPANVQFGTIIHNTQRDQGLYRPPKQSEVTTVLEAAITSPNVFSSKERIQFTSTLSPENARDKFLALSPHFVQRNEMTVLDFKNRLSSFWDE